MRQRIVHAQHGYFGTRDVMREASPRLILERGEAVDLPPTLLLHDSADTNVPIAMAEEFATAYRAAGGCLQIEVFLDAPHFFALQGGPDTIRALRLMKEFIAAQLNTRDRTDVGR